MRDITRPPRLSRGAGDGVTHYCAMQVISWENGDTKITDYPECSARPLARMVQMVNDRLADESSGYLSPEDSITVLELGHLTVGTAGYSRDVLKRWLHDLLVDPVFGVVQHAPSDGQAAVRHVADLLSRADEPYSEEWLHARRAAYAAADAAYAAATYADATYAANAAYAAANAANAAADMADFTRWAVQRFRDLMGLDTPVVDAEATEAAVEKMLAR